MPDKTDSWTVHKDTPHISARPWEAASFDPQGIFFITHRSETCGVALALESTTVDGAPVGVVATFGVKPDSRRKGIGRCLLRLCIQRHKELGRSRVLCAIDRQRAPEAWQLLTSEGFTETEDCRLTT
eukprot:gnl/TRDRNA2_/TRDRNA2_53210_c0_seq2.p1 gnl/TRDRNA2_/TRDRNA2_53210_c0~~gnl/TRDRNA2_/TRDRNA2_53210_c0_seq2.p1  ORF type:complete len:127 (-),score=7.81 gnl/TRDRNA2_/TRDRNA2_53210_c0_seq2:38-418(-)